MKNTVFAFLFILFLIACKNENASSTNTVSNEKIIQEYFTHFNQHNWEKMADMYATTAEFKAPSLGTGIVKQSRKEIVKKYSELNAMFPDIQDKINQIYTSGDKHIIVEFISIGTAYDSTKLHLPICTVFEIENGKIIKDFTYYDN